MIIFIHDRVEMYLCDVHCISTYGETKATRNESIVSGIRNHQGLNFLLSFSWEFFLCFCLSISLLEASIKLNCYHSEGAAVLAKHL